MDHTFLNASNTPSSFSNDLQTAEKLYFTHDREQIFTDESDSDENESSNSEEEPDNSIELLGPEIEWTECDVNDRQKVESFMNKGCGCLHGSEGKSCSKRYSVEQVLEHRQICLEMTSSELDMVVLAQFGACTRQDDISFSSRQQRKRKRACTYFTFRGKSHVTIAIHFIRYKMFAYLVRFIRFITHAFYCCRDLLRT